MLGFFFGGMALGIAVGVMLMAVVQHHSKRGKNFEVEQLANSVHVEQPRRWNGRYPRDEEYRA
jgi:hypothetical protein